jgi:hypothetical protein
MAYGAAVEVLRVAVNVGSSLGSSGIETGLAPSMTVGTGFFGRSSVAENLQPKHLVQWTRLAYNSDPAEPFGNFTGLVPWETPAGPVPPYPFASNAGEVVGRERGGYPLPAHQTPGSGNRPAPAEYVPAGSGGAAGAPATGVEALREEIRRLVIEELGQMVGGGGGG